MTTISAATTAPALASPGAAGAVAHSGNGALAGDAVSLAADSAVVSLLGGGDPFGATYDAAGLFNVIAQAGTPDAGSAPQASPPSVDQQIVGALTQPNSASTSLAALAATVPAGAIDQNASYAAILKQTPSLAATVIGESTAQAIISTWA